MVTKVLIFFIFLMNFAYAECNLKQKNLKLINIDLKNSQSFFKKASRFFISVNSNQNSSRFKKYPQYKKAYQKKTEAIVTFETKDNLKCSFKARLRGHGDGGDHLELVNGVVLSSYRVRLNEGNLNNITRFILFRPTSRNFENEIFISTLMRELGFLSPRTFKVKVKVNNVVSEYIFQENLKKEFLEYNNRVEGPLLEAKEDFYNFNKLSFSRISNVEWIKNIGDNYIISMNALKNFNTHRLYGYNLRMKSIKYLENIGRKIEKNYKGLAIDEVVRFKKDNLEISEFRNIGTFQSFMFALDASHALSYDDARFYYDPIYNRLEPIYYDGNSNILSKINYDAYTGNYKNELPNWKKVKKNTLDFEEYLQNSSRHNLFHQVVTELARDNAPNAILKLEKINHQNLLIELRNNGMKDLSKKQLLTLIEFIKLRLTKISESKVKENLVLKGNQFQNFEKEMGLKNRFKINFLKEYYEINEKLNLITDECDYDLKNCSDRIIKNSQINNFMEQKKMFLARSKQQYKNGTLKKFLIEFEKEFKTEKYLDQFNIIRNEGTSIIFDEKQKEILINFTSEDGRIVISNSKIDNWKINMNNNIKENNLTNTKLTLRSKKLTGCLTIIDSIVENIEINASNFFCEDTVNFIRTKGTIDKIKINKSLSDGLDIDFSDISIFKLDISNSGNDCVDFSFGNYKIDKMEVSFCGDKALSVGEKSKVVIDKFNAERSVVGIASKDSSETKINEVTLANLDICLTAYNKKQEFNGGLINVNKFLCENFNHKTQIDEQSTIIINGSKL